MKRIFLGAAMALAIAINAQDIDKKVEEDRTVFNGISSFGGFLGVSTKVGDINGQSALLVGGEIAAVFSSQFNIGFVGYGLTTQVESDVLDQNNEPYELHMGYGGLLLEPVIASKRMVHLTLPIILGVGGAGTHRSFRSVDQTIRQLNPDEAFYDRYDYETDVILVGEPGLNLEINLLRHVRLDIGASYRYVYDSQIEGISDEELSGPTVNAGLRFGWF